MTIFKDLGVRDGADREKEGVIYNLAACYALVEKELTRFLSPYGLSPVKLNALLMTKHVNDGQGLTQRDLGTKMIVSPGNITRLLDRLEKDGLTTRELDPNDRRIRKIKITKKAIKLLDRVWPSYLEKVDELVSRLGSKDVTSLSSSLNIFRTILTNNN